MADDKPRKIRTWWHPLLANLLRWQLGSHYHLEEEVPVGQKPLQIDILLLHKEQGELPQSARQILAGLVEYLGEFTLLEFKSPSDTLRAGDFQTFLAYALLYRAQNHSLLDPSQLHLLVLAPRLTKPYREELLKMGVTAQPQDPGIWRLQGGMAVHPMWVLETEELAGLSHPLLTLISPTFLENRLATYDLLRHGGYTNVVVYLAQQITQFRLRGKEFAMQHLGTEDEMQRAWRDLLATLPPEERLEGLSPEERLEGLSPEERLEGLSPEERLHGLTPDEMRQAWRDLLVTLSPEERLEGMSAERRLEGLPPEKRLAGLSPEERLRGLTPVDRERLRLLLQQLPPKEEDQSSPK